MVDNRCYSKTRLNAGKSENPLILWIKCPLGQLMKSENSKGADNQQERLVRIGWIVGFTDGDGCFSVSIFRNKTSKLGWQVMPEFVLTQGESSLSVLEKTKEYFDCGRIYVNRRYDNHRENIYRYCVRNRKDLLEKIVPFFETYPLKTQKVNNFIVFTKVLRLMKQGRHLKKDGLHEIADLVGKQLE